MKLGSLFAGIGGFELAATWAGIEPIWSNEIDSYSCDVLRKNFNHEIIQKDIRKIGKQNLAPVDIISGGFPCQPFSNAGKRKGTEDDRYLWPEMLRVISELKPSFVIGENVAGLLSMENGETLKRILSDLENEGYNNEIFIIPACGVQAWHRRDRIWIVSHRISDTMRKEGKRGVDLEQNPLDRSKRKEDTNGFTEICQDVSESNSSGYIHGKSKEQPTKGGINALSKSKSSGEHGKDVSNTMRSGSQGQFQESEETKRPIRKEGFSEHSSYGWLPRTEYWETEPDVGRVANGIPNRVDRLKGLGNAIVPQVAYELFKAINDNNQLNRRE